MNTNVKKTPTAANILFNILVGIASVGSPFIIVYLFFTGYGEAISLITLIGMLALSILALYMLSKFKCYLNKDKPIKSAAFIVLGIVVLFIAAGTAIFSLNAIYIVWIK